MVILARRITLTTIRTSPRMHRVRRTVGDEVADEAVGSTRVRATRVVLIVSGGREVELRVDDSGAWLTDDVGTRPVKRVGRQPDVPAAPAP